MPPAITHVMNSWIWTNPQAMRFEELSAADLTPYVIDQSTSVNFRVELDDPLNFISTSGSMDISLPTEANELETLNLDDLQENALIIKIYETGAGVQDFLGVVDPKQSYYDNIEQIYHLYFYDLFSFMYNHISNYLGTITVDGRTIGDLFPYYQELSLGDQYIPLDFFLKTYNSLNENVSTDVDISFIVERARVLATQVGAITINNFLDQVRNHYGAYVYINGAGTINLVSRNRGLLNAGSVDITDDIIEEEYTQSYTLPAEYNAVRCSSIINDDEGTTIIDHLIYYDGELQHKFIYSDTDLSSFDYLDLRTQIPGGISALYLFANRSIDDLKEIYGDIIKPRSIVKCSVDRIDLPILKRVTIGDKEYIIMNMEKSYEERTSVLELLRKQ